MSSSERFPFIRLAARRLQQMLWLLLTIAVSTFALGYYILPPLKYYYLFYLSTFDYGILFETSQKVLWSINPFLWTRGVRAWGDNQDYFQILFSWVHFTPWPHHALLIVHSLVIFSCGLVPLLYLRDRKWTALMIAVFTWLSPFLANANIDVAHTESFATILLLLTFFSALYGWKKSYWVFFVLALLCKEDVAITLGAFAFLAAIFSREFSLPRKFFIFSVLASLAILALNQGLILPVSKVLSCQSMSSTFEAALLQNSSHTSPWFENISTKILHSWFWDGVFNAKVLRYLLLFAWPLLLTWRHGLFFWAIAVPGLAINVLGGSYLTEGWYHYDHSTFACALAGLLIYFKRADKVFVKSLVLAGVSVWFAWDYEIPMPGCCQKCIRQNCSISPCNRVIRVPLAEFMRTTRDDFTAVEKVSVIEEIHAALPNDIAISADYTSLNYLLPGRELVYMFDNPFRSESFGIYGVCDGVANSFDLLPQPDVVILTNDKKVKESIAPRLKRGYTRYLYLDESDALLFQAWVRDESSRAVQVTSSLLGVGFSEAPFGYPLATEEG